MRGARIITAAEKLMIHGESGGGLFVGPELAWQKRAACAQAEAPDSFFPGRGAPSWRSKAVCAECPVREECLDWGLAHEEQGIWGGLTEGERRKLLASRLGIRFTTTTEESQ